MDLHSSFIARKTTNVRVWKPHNLICVITTLCKSLLLDLPQVPSILVSWFIPFSHVLYTHFLYIYLCSSADCFICLIDPPPFFLLWRTCKDNGDKAFANCSIPQEKTNAEINAELDLSDASADEADDDRSNPKGFETSAFFLFSSVYFFVHYNVK
jgi:hypothetical protein